MTTKTPLIKPKEQDFVGVTHDSEGQPVYPESNPDAHDLGIAQAHTSRTQVIDALESALIKSTLLAPECAVKIIGIEQLRLAIGTMRLAFDLNEK